MEFSSMSYTITHQATAPGFAWSYSQLKNFETCPKRYLHYNILRDVQEPETDQIKWGHAVHGAFDARLKTGASLPLGMGQWEGMLAKFADAPGVTYAEQKLALTSDFRPVAFFGGSSVWCRTVIDAAKVRDDHTATIVDWKTGKPSTDTTQLQLMSAVMFAQDPKLVRVKAGLMFINHNQSETEEYVRTDVTEIWSDILPRVRKVIDARQAQEYPPKPSGLCKRYCAVVSCPYNGK
jgi:hypothetical protein